MKHLSDSDISYVMKSIFLLSSWEVVELEDNMRWWIVQSIWRETVQLENKARAKKWEKTLCYQLATLGATPSSKTCDQTKPNQINPNQAKSNQNTDISIDIWEQALVVFWKEWVNEVIKTIKESVEEMWWVYKSSTRERQYANHIAEKHKDWWQFLEKRKDWKSNLESVKEIIYFSLNPNNSYVKQIINAEDFWNKWADVIMAMRKEHIEKRKEHIEKTKYNPTGNPLLNF